MAVEAAERLSGQDGSASGSRVQTRDLLLNSVGRLISERNSLTFSLNEVAAHAGMNAALVKYYFGGKSGMLLALLERDLEPHLRALEVLLELDIPPARKMRIHLEGMVRAYFRHPFINRLITHVMTESDDAQARQVHARYVVPVIDAYRRLLEEGVAQGAFRPVDPILFYVSAVGMCDQLVSSRLSLEFSLGPGCLDETLSRRYGEQISAMVLNGILAA